MKSSNDKVKLQELIGRKAFEELMLPYTDSIKLRFTDYQYESYDCWWEYFDSDGNRKAVLVEIKVRHNDYDSYILEDSKFRKMETAYFRKGLHKKDVTLLYVNFTPKNTYIWDITNINQTIKAQENAFNRNSITLTDKVFKRVYYLPTDIAKKAKYQINITKIINDINNEKTKTINTYA